MRAHCFWPLKVLGGRTRHLMAKCTVCEAAMSSRCEMACACCSHVLATQLSLRTDFRTNPVKEAVVKGRLGCPLFAHCVSYQYEVPMYQNGKWSDSTPVGSLASLSTFVFYLFFFFFVRDLWVLCLMQGNVWTLYLICAQVEFFCSGLLGQEKRRTPGSENDLSINC